jgi:hypothetical protein
MVAGARKSDAADGGDTRSAWAAAAFVVYASIAWMPCLVGGALLGSALVEQPADEGVTQGKTMGVSGALSEILISTVILLAIAYVIPVLWLNRKRA